jgi:hypothetical protein
MANESSSSTGSYITAPSVNETEVISDFVKSFKITGPFFSLMLYQLDDEDDITFLIGNENNTPIEAKFKKATISSLSQAIEAGITPALQKLYDATGTVPNDPVKSVRNLASTFANDVLVKTLEGIKNAEAKQAETMSSMSGSSGRGGSRSMKNRRRHKQKKSKTTKRRSRK